MYVLAKNLDKESFEVFFASSREYISKIDLSNINFIELYSISNHYFLTQLKRNKPIYNEIIIRKYINNDREIIKTINPDLIIGDFRLSLNISSRLEEKPFFNLCNAHWSPYAIRSKVIIPEHFLIPLLGERIMIYLSKFLEKKIVNSILTPFNKLRIEAGLEPYKTLEHLYTDGDKTLYCDLPTIVPMIKNLHETYYIGPVLWSPQLAIDFLPVCKNFHKKTIYFTIGSSGPNINNFQKFLIKLGKLPYTFYVSTGGKEIPQLIPRNVIIRKFFNGIRMCKIVDIVICNGGPTIYQSLKSAKPIIAFCTNYDQHLRMSFIEDLGMGMVIRSEKLSIKSINKSIKEILSKNYNYKNLEKFAKDMKEYNNKNLFQNILTDYFFLESQRINKQNKYILSTK